MMKSYLAWLALACLSLTAPASADAAPAAADEGGQVVGRSRLGAWLLKDDASHPGKNCAIRFVAAKRDAAGLAIFGPTASAGAATSAIVLQGPNLPAPRAPQDTPVELVQTGLPPATLRAQLLPAGPGASGALAIALGDLRQTLASMRDSESDMRVRMSGVEVIRLDYDGFDRARSALLGCLDGQRFAGKTVREATAEIRPLGNSSIAGTAFYKGALLAKKQYPPKGSRAVGLIWMTDEFKAWYELVKRQNKLPEQIPEDILKHFMSTTILDDTGGFRFDKLPAGEYTLIANFSYEENINRPEVIGRTDVYAGNRYIGSNDQVAWWSYTVKRGASFSKNVAIARDGEQLEVVLDKSRLICFLVCR